MARRLQLPAEIAKRRNELKEQRQADNEAAAHRAVDTLINTTYREQFAQGDREQLIKCVWLCWQAELPIPSWARDALGTACAKWLQEPQAQETRRPLDYFLFGSRKGRHARASQVKIDIRNRQMIREAVEIVASRGAKGEQRFTQAYRLLDDCRPLGVTVSAATPESVKAIYFKAVKEELPRNPQIEAELQLYADPPTRRYLRDDLRARAGKHGAKER